jgi:hypothetical protein
LCLTLTAQAAADSPEPATIDQLLGEQWKRHGVKPAAAAGDTTLLRRLSLDLIGRVPTIKELDGNAPYDDRVRQLLDSPEFTWYFANVLDEIIQGKLTGDGNFVGYLRQALKENKSWDAIFRDVMVGPWDTAERKPAIGFLDKRTKDIDVLTVDTTRAFFGVDISCARCHDHPLVKDWKRDHYYGMAAFLVRTSGGKGAISEKKEGEAKFAGRDGKEKTAPMMFLTGRTLEPEASAKAKTTRRDQLVKTALDEKKFFSRSFVNRLWEYFFGQGLVNPVDQMHSGNPASVPPLLDQLADDFASSGYDIKKLVSAIVLSKAYRQSSRFAGTLPDPGHFAVARLRPLSPRQFARSLLVVLGDGTVDHAALDKQAADLMPLLDPRTVDFQSSAREALFVSNADAMRKLVMGGEKSTVERLSAIANDGELVKTAIRTIHGRDATATEISELESWLKRYAGKRREACEDLVWALAMSAEFRFNH